MGSLEGLWTMQFESPSSGWANGGVMVFANGHLLGGDSGYYYIGTYNVDGDHVHGTIGVVRHAEHGEKSPAWGEYPKEFTVIFEGNYSAGSIRGSVVRPRQSDFRAHVVFHRQAEIPG